MSGADNMLKTSNLVYVTGEHTILKKKWGDYLDSEYKF